MDPNACLNRIIESIQDGDMNEAKFAIIDLQEWMQKGGFHPQVSFKQFGDLLQIIADRLR